MLLPFQNPASVVQRSPMSGLFGSSAYADDKAGFVSHLLGYWYCIHGNTIPCEGPQHIAAAERLYDFYRAYREQVNRGLKGGHLVLITLYRTASIEDAKAVLSQLGAE
jgi:hypothetical protein